MGRVEFDGAIVATMTQPMVLGQWDKICGNSGTKYVNHTPLRDRTLEASDQVLIMSGEPYILDLSFDDSSSDPVDHVRVLTVCPPTSITQSDLSTPVPGIGPAEP